MTKRTLRNTILFTILLTLMVISATGLSYVFSGIAYDQQREEISLSANVGTLSQQVSESSQELGIPSMVATPSEQP